MRIDDIKIGGTYLAKVGAQRVRVRVDGVSSLNRNRFNVTNLTTGRNLTRSAAALHLMAGSISYAIDERAIPYAEAVNLVNQHVGVGTWSQSSVKARSAEGLVIAGVGTLRIKIEA